MATKKAAEKAPAKATAEPTVEAEPQTEEAPQYYGSLEGIMPRDEPGIVITGAEQFDGKQGFIPAGEAEAKGVSVTGKVAADAKTAKK